MLFLTIFLLLAGCAEITDDTGEYSNTADNQEVGEIAAESMESISNLPELHTIYEYKVQELSAERDGLSIYGEAYIPDVSQEKIPIVIMSHGFNSNYASQVEYAAKLAEIGIASYIFDFCGGSTVSRSDGTMLDMSLRTEVTDLNAVIDFIQTLDFVDTENIFLMGRSMGGAVSALAAAQRQNDIKGLILIYPAFVIPDNSKQYASVDVIPEQTTLMGATVGKRFHEDNLGEGYL